MKQFLIPLLLSVVGTVVLFVGAGMAGGACHCMKPLFTLFPYGGFVMMTMSSDSLGLLFVFLQFPSYTVMVMVAKGERWKVIMLLLIITLHLVAASFALRN